MAQYFNPAQSASDPYSDAHQGQQSQMYLAPQQGSYNPDYPPQQSLYTPNVSLKPARRVKLMFNPTIYVALTCEKATTTGIAWPVLR